MVRDLGSSDQEAPELHWPDAHLVSECLTGNDRAWAALIQRYKRLIYSVPVKYGASPEDAADIFQSVCLEMFSQLSKLRKVDSLKSWLITVAAHQSLRWKHRQRPGDVELDAPNEQGERVTLKASDILPPQVLEELEREQTLREALRKLRPRCREMVKLLFYEQPPLPYAEVAQRLGIATGSIGFIRNRCLKNLQNILTKIGF